MGLLAEMHLNQIAVEIQNSSFDYMYWLFDRDQPALYIQCVKTNDNL